MAKRKTFYVSAAIFELPLSAYAIAVYCYLSFCADRQGSCFPSIATIAERCGMSRTTAKKAKQELKDAGMIRAEEAYVPCANGRRAVPKTDLCGFDSCREHGKAGREARFFRFVQILK